MLFSHAVCVRLTHLRSWLRLFLCACVHAVLHAAKIFTHKMLLFFNRTCIFHCTEICIRAFVFACALCPEQQQQQQPLRRKVSTLCHTQRHKESAALPFCSHLSFGMPPPPRVQYVARPVRTCGGTRSLLSSSSSSAPVLGQNPPLSSVGFRHVM